MNMLKNINNEQKLIDLKSEENTERCELIQSMSIYIVSHGNVENPVTIGYKSLLHAIVCIHY